MGISLEKIKKAQELNFWNFGNQVLYDMCQKAPKHTSETEIVGKVWLIGRSYAAAIERGANSPYTGDQFYRFDVAQKIKAAGVELDNKIECLEGFSRITEDLLE